MIRSLPCDPLCCCCETASYGVLRCYRGMIACSLTAPGVNLTIHSMLWRSTPVEVCSRLRRFHIFGEKKTHLDYYQVFGVFSVFPFSCRPTLKLAWEASSLTVRHFFGQLWQSRISLMITCINPLWWWGICFWVILAISHIPDDPWLAKIFFNGEAFVFGQPLWLFRISLMITC